MAYEHDQTFEVNGQTYKSLDDVPQPYRDSIAAMLADRDGDGVPDAFQTGASSTHVVHNVSEFQVDGVSYSSIDDVPESRRADVSDALGRLQAAAPGPRSAVTSSTSGPSPIVTKAGWSGRAKLLAAFMAVDAAIVIAVIWAVTR